jgi:hypothetical protein
MKKQLKKLVLAKETVRKLEALETLNNVHGGSDKSCDILCQSEPLTTPANCT